MMGFAADTYGPTKENIREGKKEKKRGREEKRRAYLGGGRQCGRRQVNQTDNSNSIDQTPISKGRKKRKKKGEMAKKGGEGKRERGEEEGEKRRVDYVQHNILR